MKYERIGISGGTFDPVHHGHLIVAEEIRQKFHLDKVLFIPTGSPPHKANSQVAKMEDRFQMVCQAIRTNPHFEVSRIEMDRKGYTYTVDTLSSLKEIYTGNTKLYFIIGADVVRDLFTWKDYERVFELCEFVAAIRAGYPKDAFIGQIETVNANYPTTIHIADVPVIDISSTMVRERIYQNRSIKYLVPESVEKYILESGLYKKG